MKALSAQRCSGDRGSASLWLLAVALAVVLLTGAVAMAGGYVVARHRAEAAADLGALAGAAGAVEGADSACYAAERIVKANGADLVACAVEGLDVVVTARVEGPGGWGAATGSARAGPLRATGAAVGPRWVVRPAGVAVGPRRPDMFRGLVDGSTRDADAERGWTRRPLAASMVRFPPRDS